MKLKARSFRVADEWVAHLETQTERVSTQLGERVYLYELMGACIMNFAPADDQSDLARLQSFIPAFRIAGHLGDISHLTENQKDALRKLLG